MSMMIMRETAKRFLQDRAARLAPIPVANQRTRHARIEAILKAEEQNTVRGGEWLLLGAIAALYVLVRIGLTYGAVTH